MLDQRAYEEQDNTLESWDKDYKRCVQQFAQQFDSLRIGSESSIMQSSKYLIEYDFIENTNKSIPLFVQSKPRKTFNISTSYNKNIPIIQTKTITVKRWKILLRVLISECQMNFQSTEYSILSSYLKSLDYSPDKFRQILGFKRTISENQILWVESQGHDEIRRVLLEKVESHNCLKITLKLKCSQKQKLQLISSLIYLRNFIVDPTKHIQ